MMYYQPVSDESYPLATYANQSAPRPVWPMKENVDPRGVYMPQSPTFVGPFDYARNGNLHR
jgi:hypothetical protein